MNDAPEGWQLGFQDSASPIAEGILRIHNEIQYYLLIILVLICWIITSIIFKFNEESNKFKSKYMNHGKIVPTRKGSKFKIYTTIRTYSTLPNENNDSPPAKIYEDIYSMKDEILKENIDKSGIYKLTNNR